MKIIDRPFYMNTLLNVLNTPDIKILTGVRRCGKSVLLGQLKNHLVAQENTNVVHVNFSLVEFENLLEYHALYAYANEQYNPNSKNYLLVDEVQECRGFERALNSLQAEGRFTIVVTGSNAFLLSSDLATLFTGRTYSISVFPFSYGEFLNYFDQENSAEAFSSYFTMGGMPGSYVYADDAARAQYVRMGLETLIVRDIVQKHGIKNEQAFAKELDYLLDNIGNLTALSKVSHILSQDHDKLTATTAYKYADYLCKAFLFYEVWREDVVGKRLLRAPQKFYVVDPSFRFAQLGRRSLDYGRCYENMVAIDLLRRGYDIRCGYLRSGEVDFVARKGSEQFYIQVADNISEQTTLSREVTPLLKIANNYPKYVLANTNHDTYFYEGIEVMDISRWLLR